MAFELRELQGVAFKNDDKASEKMPDWRGEFLLNGQKMEWAAWEKDGKRGMFLSFKIGEARERKPARGFPSDGHDDSGVPF
jgi:hypothetical protein